MKTQRARLLRYATATISAIAVLPCLLSSIALSQDKNPKNPSAGPDAATDLDLAGDVSRYFGQRANLYRDNNRKLAKIDLDADFNYDGTIDNYDPADNGAFQQTPPGLVVGAGELSKIVIRLTPYKIDYAGRAKVRLQVDGINRDDKSGKFAEGEASSATGRIRVWRDSTKKELILDSHAGPLSFDWTLDMRTPSNLQIVPRTLYVEGVTSSPRHSGDIRLLLSVFDEKISSNNISYDPKNPSIQESESKKSITSLIKTFRPSYDHILLTVRSAPQEKNFVNNNSEGVWLQR